MKALTWHDIHDVRVEEVPDPTIQEPTDAIVRMTSTAICGSDLHLYDVLDPYLNEGDILGHEPMGIVEEVGPDAAETVVGVDLVPERMELARRHGVEVVDAREHEDGEELAAHIRDMTDGRGPDSVIDAVGMEAHGSPFARTAQKMAGALPDSAAESVFEKAGVDRLDALLNSIHTVRRGGTLSIIGVYGGAADPLPMMELFDKGVQMRMGQAHVKRWTPEILPILEQDEDVLGTEDLASHHLPLDEASRGYEMFRDKTDEATKVVLHP